MVGIVAFRLYKPTNMAKLTANFDSVSYFNVVYRTIDTLTGEMYIGSKRKYIHGKYYGSPLLIKAQEIIKTRPHTLKVEILEIVDSVENLIEREAFWQKKFNVVNDDLYWNQCFANKGFSTLGKKLTEGHKSKISKAGKGRIASEEAKKNMAKAQKGKVISEDTKIKLRHSVSQLWGSNEYKNKQSKSHKAYFENNPIARKKVTESLKRRYETVESRERVSQERKAYFSLPGTKKNLSDVHTKYYILDTNTGIYYNREEAAKILNILPNNVRRLLENKNNKTSLKFV